jgi:hypothetical protein
MQPAKQNHFLRGKADYLAKVLPNILVSHGAIYSNGETVFGKTVDSRKGATLKSG